VTVEWSDTSILVVFESDTLSDSKSMSSSVEGSDGLCSSVEGEPLSLVIWVVVLDLEIVLTSTEVSAVEDRSVFSHSGSNLEFDSGGKWLLSEFNTLSVDRPSLVSTVVALVPVDMSSMGV